MRVRSLLVFCVIFLLDFVNSYSQDVVPLRLIKPVNNAAFYSPKFPQLGYFGYLNADSYSGKEHRKEVVRLDLRSLEIERVIEIKYLFGTQNGQLIVYPTDSDKLFDLCLFDPDSKEFKTLPKPKVGDLEGAVLYYQNNLSFSAEMISEDDIMLTRYNLKTGAKKPYADKEGFPIVSATPTDMSPDKMHILLVGFNEMGHLFDVGKEAFTNTIPIQELTFYFKSLWFLNNNYLYTIHSDEPAHSQNVIWGIYDLNGRLEKKVRFDYGNKVVMQIGFFNELKTALLKYYDVSDRSQGWEFVDTTSFRDYLDKNNLLFRPTTAVATDSQVRVRENPNTEAQVYGALTKGDELEVLDRSGVKVKIGDSTDWWYKIKRKSYGLSGWAFGAFLKLLSYQGELGPKK